MANGNDRQELFSENFEVIADAPVEERVQESVSAPSGPGDEVILYDLFERAVGLGYEDDYDSFVNLLNTDSVIFEDVYQHAKSQGYEAGKYEFASLIGANNFAEEFKARDVSRGWRDPNTNEVKEGFPTNTEEIVEDIKSGKRSVNGTLLPKGTPVTTYNEKNLMNLSNLGSGAEDAWKQKEKFMLDGNYTVGASTLTDEEKQYLPADPENPVDMRVVEDKLRSQMSPEESLKLEQDAQRLRLSQGLDYRYSTLYKEENEETKAALINKLEEKITLEKDPLKKKYQEFLLSSARENNNMQLTKSFDMWLEDISPEEVREIQEGLTEEQIPQQFKDDYKIKVEAYTQRGGDTSKIPSFADWFKGQDAEYYNWFLQNNQSSRTIIQNQARDRAIKDIDKIGDARSKMDKFFDPPQSYLEYAATEKIGTRPMTDVEVLEEEYEKKWEEMIDEARAKKFKEKHGKTRSEVLEFQSKLKNIDDYGVQRDTGLGVDYAPPLSMEEKLKVKAEYDNWIKQQKISAEKEENLKVRQDPVFVKDLNKLTRAISIKDEDSAAAFINRNFGKYGIVANPEQNDGKNSIWIQSGRHGIEVNLFPHKPMFSSGTEREIKQAKRIKQFIYRYASPAVEINTNISDKAITAQKLRKTPRIDREGNKESFKWDMYREGNNYKVVPTLFPTNKDVYDSNPALWTEAKDLEQAKEIASMRAEVFTFTNEKDAKDFMSQWNNITPAEAVAVKHYAARGLDYLAHRKNLNYLKDLQSQIDYYEKMQYLDDPRVREEIYLKDPNTDKVLDPSSEEFKQAYISANTPFDRANFVNGNKTYEEAAQGGTTPIAGRDKGTGNMLLDGLVSVYDFVEGGVRGVVASVQEQVNPEAFAYSGPEVATAEIKRLKKLKEQFKEMAFNEDLLRAQEDLDSSLQREMERIVSDEGNFMQAAQMSMNNLNLESLAQFGVHMNQLPYIQPKTEEELAVMRGLFQDGVDAESAYRTATTLKKDAQLFFNLKHDKAIKSKIDDGMEWYVNAISNGWRKGEAAKVMYQIMQHNSPMQLTGKVYSIDDNGFTGSIDISDVEARRLAAEKISNAYKKESPTTSRFMNRWSKADGFWEAFQVISDDPLGGSLALFAESMSQMGPYGMQILPQHVGAGAALGGWSGALMGVRSAFSTTSFIMEYTATIFDEMQKLEHSDGTPYSITNPDDVFAALGNQEFLDKAADRGVTRGVPIALIDFLTANLAGRLFRPSVLTSRAGQLARLPFEQVMSGPIAGSAGEYAAQLNEIRKGYRKEVDQGEVVLEGYGEIFGNVSNLAINVAQDMNKISNINLADKLTDIDYVNSLPDSDKKISNWANKMFDAGEIDGETNQAIQENVSARKQAGEIADVASKQSLIDRVTRRKRSSKESITKRLSQLIRAKERLSKTEATKGAYKDQIRDINDEIKEISKTGRLRLKKDEVTVSASPTNKSTITKVRDFVVSLGNIVNTNPETKFEAAQREEQEFQERTQPRRRRKTQEGTETKFQVDVSEEVTPVAPQFFAPNKKGVKSRVTRDEFINHIDDLTDEEINKQIDDDLIGISNVSLKDDVVNRLEESIVDADGVKESTETDKTLKQLTLEAVYDAQIKPKIDKKEISLVDVADNKKEILVKGKPTKHNIVKNTDGTFAVEIEDKIVKDKLNSESEAITAYVEEISEPTKIKEDAVQEQSTTEVDADKQTGDGKKVEDGTSTTKPKKSTGKKRQDKKDEQEKVEGKKKVSSKETKDVEEDVDTIISDMMAAIQKQEDETYYVQPNRKDRPDFKGEESVEFDVDESQMITQVMNKMKSPNIAVKINPTKKRTSINVDDLNKRSETKFEKLTPEQFEERFSNIPFIFTISDALTAGEVTNPNTGNKITNLRGGLGFHGQKGNENAAWANLKGKAKGLLDEAQEVYQNNKAIFDAWWKANPEYNGLVPMAVVKMGEDSTTSNEALFRVVNDNLTKIPKANKRKALTYLKNKKLPSLIENYNRLVEEGEKKGAKKESIEANIKKAKQMQNILNWIKDNKMTTIEDVLNVDNLQIEDSEGNPVISLADRVLLINQLLIGKPNKHGESKQAPTSVNKNSVTRVLMGLDQEEGVGQKNPAAHKKFKKFAPLLTMSTSVDLITEPAMKDVQQRDIIAITGVDVKNPKVLQTKDGDFTHPNYPEGVRGKSLGVLTESISMQELFPAAYNQVAKVLLKYEKQQKGTTLETISSEGVPTQSGLSAAELRGAQFESLSISDRNKLINFINTSFPQVRVYTDKDSFARIMENENVKQYKKGDQVIYGMTLGRDIYINPDVHRSESAIYNTAIHEMGHVWLNTLEGTRKGKQLLKKGKSLVEQTQEYQKYLKEFNGDKDRAAKEALAVLIGNKGETITDAALKTKFEEWLLALWNYVKQTFKLSKDLTAEEVQNLTLDEFVGTALADIMSGKELKLTAAQSQMLNLNNPEVFFKADDSVSEIVQRARLNNFADRHIREYLKRFTDLTEAEITEALAVPLEEDGSQLGLFTEYLPESFANVEGGVNVGMETYTNIKDKLKDFAHTGKSGRRTKKIQKTFAEIREQAQRLLSQERAYKRASAELQSQMRIDLDKSMNISDNKKIGQQITKLQNLLADRRVKRLMKGKVQDLQSIKKQVRNFIRKNMPEAKYSRSEVNKLLNQVTKASEQNLMQVLNEVEDIIVTKKVQEVKNKIDKLLSLKKTVTVVGRLKGTMLIKDQERLDNLNKDIVRVKKQADLVKAIEKKQTELRARRAELIQKRSEGLTQDEQAKLNVEIIDIDTALNYNEASLMENDDAVKLATYEGVLQNLDELISDARLGYKAEMKAAVERYNKLKGEFYKDITGNDIDFNDKDSIRQAEDDLKRIQKKREKRQKVLGKLGVAYRGLSNFVFEHEAIEGMLSKISYMPAEMFEGKASEIILDRLDESARRFRQGQYDAMRVLEEKAKEIWGTERRLSFKDNKTYRQEYQVALENMALKTIPLTTLNNPKVVGSIIVQEDVAALDKEIKEVEAKIERYKLYTKKTPIKKRTEKNLRLAQHLKELKQRREDTQEMFSQAQLYYLYNQYKDKANHPGFKATFGENYDIVMDEVLEKLDPKVKEWADWQVEEFFPSVYNKYNATYRNIYRTNMPWNKQYAGRLRRQVAGEVDVMSSMIEGSNQYLTAVGGGSTKQRQANKQKIRYDVDGNLNLQTYINEMEFFAAYGENVRDIQKLMTTPQIKDAISTTTGEDVYNILNDQLKRVMSYNITQSTEMIGLIDSFTGAFVTAKLGLNPVVMVKQLTSAVAFADYIGYRNWVKYATVGLGRGIKNAKDGIVDGKGFTWNEQWKELYNNSGMLQERYERSDISRVLENYVREYEAQGITGKSYRKGQINELLMYMVKFGDRGGVMGSIPNYMYYKDEFAKKYPKKTEQEIIDLAVAKVERQISSTQQSNERRYRDVYQTSSSSLARGLGAFTSSPRALLRKEMYAMRELSRKMRKFAQVTGETGSIVKGYKAAKESGKGNWKENLRTFFTYHIAIPMFFQWAAQGFGFKNKDDEELQDLFFWAPLLGNFNSLFLLGDVMKLVQDVITEKKWAGQMRNVPLFTHASTLAQTYMWAKNAKTAETKDKWWEKFWIELVEGGVGAVTGLALPINNIRKFYNNLSSLGDSTDAHEVMLKLLNYSDYVQAKQRGEDPNKKKKKSSGGSSSSSTKSSRGRGRSSRGRGRSSRKGRSGR